MIENTELRRVFSLFFEKDIYPNNISSLIATNDSITVNFNLSKCNYSDTQHTCRPNDGTLIGVSRRTRDTFDYRVYYNDECGLKNTGVILQVHNYIFLKLNYFMIFLLFLFTFL